MPIFSIIPVSKASTKPIIYCNRTWKIAPFNIANQFPRPPKKLNSVKTFEKIKFIKIRVYLNWSVSVDNSCSIMRRTCTNSVMTMGHKDVVPLDDTLKRRTLKQRKTCATKPGTTWPSRVTSVRRSSEKKRTNKQTCLWWNNRKKLNKNVPINITAMNE